MTEEQKIRLAIFGEIEKLKEQQIKLHAIFKQGKDENTTETQSNNQVNK